MSRKPLLLSGLMFLLLGGLSFWILSMQSEPEEVPFFALKRGNPDTLVVITPPDTLVVVQGGRTGWMLIDPVQDTADGLVVESMLKRLRNLRVGRRFPMSEQKLDTYGFRFPRNTIIAKYDDGLAPDTLLVGGFTLNGDEDYVRNGSGSEVALVPTRETRGYFIKRLESLRDTRFLPFNPGRVVGIRTLDKRGRVRFDYRKMEDGRWRALEPYPGPLSKRRVDDFLSGVSHMEVEGFLEGRPARIRAEASIEIVLQRGDTLSASVGQLSETPERRLALSNSRPGILLEVPERYLTPLEADLNRFRDPNIIPFGLKDVDSLQVYVGDNLTRTWKSDSWSGVSKDEAPIRRVMENFLRSRAGSFHPTTPKRLRELGFPDLSEKIVWHGAGDTLLVLERGQEGEGGLPLRGVAGSAARPGEILVVPTSPMSDLWDFLRRGE
ncbi:MAG: DUF4340 domain-containing protein [Candidatus Eisenbacteria bacterium]|uniref:DUF4340 domain-containing protein n=1 Tax=Eiseniibacteriota bacterium TaxID=2212470 RepID=A0A7Y2H275_UNCEI|nr:DUF4340 domain-containing protein [Candidatus Eisenbacteria bacterium]